MRNGTEVHGALQTVVLNETTGILSLLFLILIIIRI